MKKKILCMIPGRDLDVEVALKVMGFIWLKHLLQFSAELAVKWLGTPADIEQSGGVYTALTKESEMVSLKLRENFDEAVPNYSTQIDAAQQVLTFMETQGYAYSYERTTEQGKDLYYGIFVKAGNGSDAIAVGYQSEAEAIVKAAVMALL
jgi:hypothetical protein